MNEAEEVDLSSTLREQVAAAAQPMRLRYIGMSLALQLVLLAVVGSGGYVLVDRVRQLDRSEDGHATQAAALVQRVDALAAQNEQLKTEIVNLHKTIASTTSQDVLFLKIILLKQDIDLDLARTIAHHVHEYALRFGKDPNLVLAIIAVESQFDPKAVSPVGAVGLMQVMPHWKKVLGINGDLADPEISIKYGLQVLGFYDEMYKDPEVVLTAYNRGPGPVDKALMRGTSPTNNYAPQVLQTYARLKRLNVESAR